MNETADNGPREGYDTLILGAGPAGLQLGYFLQRAGRRYLILERAEQAGAFFEKYPRSRGLISFNKVYSIYEDPEIRLRWDWNSLLDEDYAFLFRRFSKRIYPSAEEMLQYLRGYAAHYQLRIQYGTTVTRVSKDAQGQFIIRDQDGRTYTSRSLVVATGVSLPYIPDIPGIELAEGYEAVSLKPEDYENKRVLIIGKGNSGFEIAEEILDTAALIHMASPRPITMAWKTRHPGNLRAHYTRLLDAYQLKTLHSVLDCTVDRIERRGEEYIATVTYVHADGEQDRLVYDRIIRATGFRFDGSIFDESCRPRLATGGRFPEMTSAWESTSVPDLFFAGTLMQVRDFRRSSSAFIDGFRYNIRSLFHLLEERYFGQGLPGQALEATPDALMKAVMDRVCRTSSLWTQFGFLADAIVVDEKNGRARYILDLPFDYVHDSALGKADHYYTITFDWGRWEGDVFAIDRHPQAAQAHQSVFLHPVVRRYSRGKLVQEHHLLEDLVGMYRGSGETGSIEAHSGRDMNQYHWEEHELPLLNFFASQLGQGQAQLPLAAGK